MHENKKILIIDDEAYIRRVIELKLKNRGYDVVTASDGEEGLDYFNDMQPDVVITDIQMPKMDGMTFCKITDGHKKKRPFLTIVVSCSIPRDDLDWIKDMEQIEFFEKPFSPSKLVDCIDKYLGLQEEYVSGRYEYE